MVKHWLVIGLCSILALEAFFPNVDLSDLSRVPDLLAHFEVHRKALPDITFAEFLRLHYCDPDHQATAPTDHQKLPFSKRQHHRATVLITHDPAFLPVKITAVALLETESVFHQGIHTYSLTSTIWQPPRA